MKIEKFNENLKNNKYDIYESGTFSIYDGNIKKMIEITIYLKTHEIFFEVYMHKTPISYFKIYAQPNTKLKESILKLTYPEFNIVAFHNNKKFTKNEFIEKLKSFNTIGSKKIESDNITEDYIELLYNTEKFNI